MMELCMTLKIYRYKYLQHTCTCTAGTINKEIYILILSTNT